MSVRLEREQNLVIVSWLTPATSALLRMGRAESVIELTPETSETPGRGAFGLSKSIPVLKLSSISVRGFERGERTSRSGEFIGTSELPIGNFRHSQIRQLYLLHLTATGDKLYCCVMATLTIELPPHSAQTDFNFRRWSELLADPELARLEGRVETDRYGHIIMSPPPAPSHGSFQSRIAALLDRYLQNGRVITECPISTADGVKAADVAWASPERLRELGNRICFPHAPEICVEVLSPSNTEAEIHEKMALYFDAGAKEVWLCSSSGAMTFFRSGEAPLMPASRICSDFPTQVDLR